MEQIEYLHGFKKLGEEISNETGSTVCYYEHEKSGAQLVHLKNEDPHMAFGIGFRTPPEDSTGVFHILEHSVLCGSDKYPVKEPFVELLKSSVNRSRTIRSVRSGSECRAWGALPCLIFFSITSHWALRRLTSRTSSRS